MMWQYGPYSGGNFWMMGVGMIFQILFWVGIIYLGIRLIRSIGAGGFNEQRKNVVDNKTSAAEILRQRYAKGEINRDEYQQMMDDINTP